MLGNIYYNDNIFKCSGYIRVKFNSKVVRNSNLNVGMFYLARPRKLSPESKTEKKKRKKKILASLGIMRDQLRALLKPFSTIVL